jgi:hypothetical protein
MHLHQRHFDRFQARRQWEWRLTFTLWDGLVLAAKALKASNIPLCFYWIGTVVVTVLHWVWEAIYVRRRAEPNRDSEALIGREIGDMIGFAPTRPRGDRYESTKPYVARDAHYWQVGITAILTLALGAAIYWGLIGTQPGRIGQ